jgi:hypothetical protein
LLSGVFCLLVLAGLLEQKLGELCNVIGNPESRKFCKSSNFFIKLIRFVLVVRVFDQLTWLTLISGHVLTMDAVGEKPLIPREVNHLSQNLYTEGKIDSQTTMAYLQSSMNLESTPVDPAKCDPALRLFAAVLRLCEMENRAIEGGYGQTWSPLVSSTIIWFIGMFTNSFSE